MHFCPNCGCSLAPFDPVDFGNVAIDREGSILLEGQRVPLTRRLHEVAEPLIRARGRGLTRATLAARLDDDVYDETINKYVERVRACFREIDAGFDQIEVLRGFGAYRWRFKGQREAIGGASRAIRRQVA